MDPIVQQLIARLRGDPNDADAYERLRNRYREVGDLASLANLLEGWAGNNGDKWREASDAYCEAADAVLQSSGDRARAAALYRQALHLDVTHALAADRLRGLLAEQGEHQALAEFLDSYATALAQDEGQRARAAALYRELAALCEERLGDAAAAASYRKRADALSANGYAGAPAPPAAGIDEDELASYEAQIEAEPDPARRVPLLQQLAELRASRLDDLEGGILALRQALSIAPGDIQVMHQLATLLLARARGADGARAAADHRRVAELFYQIAQGVDVDQAVPYLTAALDAVPEHDGALALLERLAPSQGRADLLPAYWVAYLASAGEGPESDQRRLYLGEAYLDAGQLDDALYCLTPVAEHGNDRANELLQRIYAEQANAPEAGPVHAEPELPRARPERPAEDPRVAEQNAQIHQLRRRLHELLASRAHEDAAEVCRQILELDPTDPEAFNQLESHYRKRRDYERLRDLLLASTRVPGLSVDARKLRLREVATLSEAKLRDAAAATSAWRGVVTLDPADRDATRSLKRLLKKGEHWDELASVLEREALATTSSDDKAALIREIALIHRDKRKDRGEAADAFRQLHALKPDDEGVADELLKACMELEQWEDAAPLLREKLERSADSREQFKLALALAEMLHERLADHAAAYEACERALELKPNDAAIFERMERIDTETQDHARLLSTLERRAELCTGAERAALFARMGAIADEELNDVDRAARYLGEALDLAPQDDDALSRLTRMFERAGRYTDLVELLRERSLLEQEPAQRAALYRRMAQTYAEYLEDDRGAAEAYEKLLEVEEDEEALRYLRQLATRDDDAAKLAGLLNRLSAVVSAPEERRDLLFDLAGLLAERLDRSAEAIATLRRIVDEVDPAFEPAIAELEHLCERLEDEDGLSLALRRRLALIDSPEQRLPLARRLADLYEQQLKRPTDAVEVLAQWASDDPRDPEPHRRLCALLPGMQRWAEMVQSLDALAAWEDDFDARERATVEAARVAFAHLKDADGAWRRLEPMVAEGHEEAEALLYQVAAGAERGARLSALWVRLAQETDDSALSAGYWRRAAQVYETMLGQPAQALEAALRRLAADLGDRAALDEVDRLAAQMKAWPRLAQVYDRLVKQAPDSAAKVELLRRHASLLEEEQTDSALDCVLRACALDPDDQDLLARAEQLALQCKRSEDLLVVYDRRLARSDEPEDRVQAAIRAARLCDGALSDRERANQYLKAALAVAPESDALAEPILQTATGLDAARPELGSDSARRALVQAHHEVASHAALEIGTPLILRASKTLREALDDERAAFDALRQGTATFPTSDALHDALFLTARRLKRLDAVDAHLSRLVDDAIDSQTAVALLRRRGKLLEGPLNRYKDAAGVYTKLLQLDPEDAEAARKLRRNLRRSGRYQDLLLAINKQLRRTDDPELRLSLLRETARTWERDLKNRWEALDAWKAVLSQDPEDERALAAVERLERGRGSSPELDDGPEPYDDEPYDDEPYDDEPYDDEPDDDEPYDAEAVAYGSDATAEAAAADPTGELGDGDDATAPGAAPAEDVLAAGAAEGVAASATEPAANAAPDDAQATEDDLASLDADLSAAGARIEELDLLDATAEPVIDVDVDETSPADAALAVPVAPRPSSTPPPLPSARPPARQGSLPPPLPQRPSAPPGSSVPPPLPPGARKPPSG